MDEHVIQMMDVIKDAIGSLGQQVLRAYANDGRIDVQEAIMLGLSATTTLMPIFGAFKSMPKTSLENMLDSLANSDIVIK